MQQPLYGLIYYLPDADGKPVPLQAVRVEANIVDMIAEVTISQTYKNVEEKAIEAIYKFPIYEAAAVCDFEATIDGLRTVRGIAKEAKQAAKEYTEAIEQGHGAYLLEEQLPDVFQCSVGNITPGQTVVIKITYVTELKHDAESEKIRFVLPTAVAPRYGSSALSTTHPTANDGKQMALDDPAYASSTDYTLDLTITCRMTASIISIESPSHPISTELNVDGDAKVSKVTLAQAITHLKDDFILVVKSRGLDEPRAFLEYNDKTETHCAMLTLVPKFQLTSQPTEFVFVVDRSGSMSGGPIQKAAQTLELILRSLPEDCHFNIVSFGSRFDSLFSKSRPYSEENFNQALNLARQMDASYGGTEMLQVINWVLENADSEIPTAVFLLTDGEVWDVDRIVETVQKHVQRKKNKLRLFGLGIGSSVSHHLVESVTRAGKGYAQFVADNERMEKKVIGMVKNAIRPPIDDYKITWTNEANEGGPSQSSGSPKEKRRSVISFFSDKLSRSPDSKPTVVTVKYRQAPHNIPTIYAGVRFVVYCVFDKNVNCLDKIKLTGESQDGPMKIEVDIDPFVLQGSKIHTLAARKLIQDLEESRSYLHNYPSYKEQNVPNEIVQEEIVKLGTMFNLASRYTSFLAIDERNNKAIRVSQQPKRREVATAGAFRAYSTSFSSSFSPSEGALPATKSRRKKSMPLSAALFSASSSGVMSGLGTRLRKKTRGGGSGSGLFGAATVTTEKSAPVVTSAMAVEKSAPVVTSAMAVEMSAPMEVPTLDSMAAPMPGSISVPGLQLLPKVRTTSNLNQMRNEYIIEGVEVKAEKERSPKLDPREATIESVHKFLALQAFSGGFPANEGFYAFFGKNEAAFDLARGDTDRDSWATCIAIVYLEVVMAGLQDEWELCRDKAERAARKACGNMYDKILEKAREWIRVWMTEG